MLAAFAACRTVRRADQFRGDVHAAAYAVAGRRRLGALPPAGISRHCDGRTGRRQRRAVRTGGHHPSTRADSPPIGAVVLWPLEVLAVRLAGAYRWELCDALGTQYWRRHVIEAGAPAQHADYQPFVSLHVPAHNEPPEMVIQTLTALRRLNQPNYEVIAIDDNTDDPDTWRPVEQWCASHDVKFVHLENWPGYKSGALTYALDNLTDPRAELIAVVDSDYQIMPDFLADCAPLFADPGLGFIQAPQDYRG